MSQILLKIIFFCLLQLIDAGKNRNAEITANDNPDKIEFMDMCPVSLTSIETYVNGLLTEDNENLTNLIISKDEEFITELEDLSYFMIKIPSNDAGNPKNLKKFENHILNLRTILSYLEWYVDTRSTRVHYIEEPSYDLAYAILHKDSYNVEKGAMIFTSIKEMLFKNPFKNIILKAAQDLLSLDRVNYAAMILLSTFTVLLENAQKYSFPMVLVGELLKPAFDRLNQITITDEEYQLNNDRLRFIYVHLPANIIQFVWDRSQDTYCIKNKKENKYLNAFLGDYGPKISIGFQESKFTIVLTDYFYYKIESSHYNQLKAEHQNSPECPIGKQLELQSWELQPSTDDKSFYIKANYDWYLYVKDGQVVYEEIEKDQLIYYQGTEWIIKSCK